ncbi:MAG: hypothetical protein CL912_06730 [Deltaproteobacteria bacterium]|nr:hypothetical protein [Deltaproteobacteria bacterium]
MEKILEFQIVDWKNYLTAVQGVTRPTGNPLTYKQLIFSSEKLACKPSSKALAPSMLPLANLLMNGCAWMSRESSNCTWKD